MPKSKKKKTVNSIIFELDNEDLSSSDVESVNSDRPSITATASDKQNSSVICIDSENDEDLSEEDSRSTTDVLTVKSDVDIAEKSDSLDSLDAVGIIDIRDEIPIKNPLINGSNDRIKVQVREEDMSFSNNALSLKGIEEDSSSSNKVFPLLTVKFHNKAVAKRYKEAIKEMLKNLIKFNQLDDPQSTIDENDMELEIWPVDCADAEPEKKNDELNNLFMIDVRPGNRGDISVPSYSQKFDVLSDTKDKEEIVKTSTGPVCFNCDGSHMLRECPEPRNQNKINEKMRLKPPKVGRYHTEDDQRYGHFVPGRISGVLRNALGLKRNQLPLHIYRMRQLGYPPGWLEDARISHSGIAMFDSTGGVIQDPEDEDGEITEAGSKDMYDIKKILDFPGYNVKASSRYKEESHHYRLPPMSETDSKLLMLERLAPNSMKAYKRKKLQLITANTSPNHTQAEIADMDLEDDDDEIEIDFPMVPPLPDDAPAAPTPPPPPSSPPPSPIAAPPPDEPAIADIPTPQVKPDRKRSLSPTLEDLEQRKKRLLEALSSDVSLPSPPQIPTPTLSPADSTPKQNQEQNSSHELDEKVVAASKTDSNEPITPRSGSVKASDLGTPLMNIASPFLKLPENENFAKDICDVLNFENLPDSTGKYKKMSSLLKKVRDEVARIQDQHD